ncbi:uncharacterized protein LOC116606501 isoform X5 [Nematostella vectensis]|uniref:uncharacterized protein LOC116606501 isoform X5 n=1 Tax=Nematostella vectensis TaxID=45351 RepID=UPI002077269C|nr:uncharacterized protein LOC116606501 isoform X5 [Nematostella vectensis]
MRVVLLVMGIGMVLGCLADQEQQPVKENADIEVDKRRVIYAPECRRYTVFNSFDRAMGNTAQNSIRCDQKDLPGNLWYRFLGAAGNAMPTSCVPVKRCGTHAPGWMVGSHPSLRYSLVTRKVCYHWSGSCCRWSNNIKVRNCGGFYVYQLPKTPNCWLRYCGNRGSLPPPPPPPECRRYTVFNSFDRAIGNTAQNSLRCDQRDLPGNLWYRFLGAAGNAMPTSCVPVKRCGTHAPGWMVGSHPSLRYSLVTRKVCYHWSGSCCRWSNNIKVRNCGGFYVYQLPKTPVCMLRYCGNRGSLPPPPSPECRRYTVFNSFDRAVANTAQNSLRCDQRDLPGNLWYRFLGAAGNAMPTSCVPVKRCGTHAPGWMVGSHPSLRYSLVTRKVCYHWSGSCCRWSNNIKVRNCGGFYVYQLPKTPVCMLRYCGNRGSLPPPPPECRRYTIFNSFDRAIGNTAQNSLKCDQRDLPGNLWYRFLGAAGNAMPTSCVPVKRCGTHAPGWMVGSHPSLRYSLVTRKVCYHWSGSCCRWSNYIKVRNCGGFYVYQLPKTPVCWLRYCGNRGSLPPPPPECRRYTVFNSFDRAIGNTAQNSLRCDQRDLPGNLWYRFLGAAGNAMPTRCVPVKRCGTHAPGWMVGSHPSLRYSLVTRKVCYHWSGSCCRWSNFIKVRNCGGFYVYQLPKTPVCWLRYCGNRGSLPPPPPPECRRYTVFNSFDRAVANTAQNSLRCDQRDLPGNLWYRFLGAAGNAMPTSCVPVKRCGTHAPGWMVGSHPSLRYSLVTRKVCYHWSGSCCRWSNYIKVRNCGGFYVYQLPKTPVCMLRYCGNRGSLPPPPPECRRYTIFNSFDRAIGNTAQNSLRCDQRDLPGNLWYRFLGAAGNAMPTRCVPVKRCGTHAPGWMVGSHPSLRYSLVTRKVCYHWSGSCCRWSNNIKVRNCGGFYVYQLPKTPVCWLRYCGRGY